MLPNPLVYRVVRPPVSSGPNKFQDCTAFTKNRYLHAVCPTNLLGFRQKFVHSGLGPEMCFLACKFLKQRFVALI
jgi:hypothetical protein